MPGMTEEYSICNAEGVVIGKIRLPTGVDIARNWELQSVGRDELVHKDAEWLGGDAYRPGKLFILLIEE